MISIMPTERLLTTGEKAKELGVGTSSIKRWADEGKLEFVTTRGGHRRFWSTAAPPPLPHAPEASIAALLKLSERLRVIGEEWACGHITVAEEHRQSHLVADSLDRMRRVNETGPLCILACPPDELHELPLRMVRLVLEWRGWRTDFLGAATPWDDLEHAVRTTQPDLVALSARSPIRIPIRLSAQVVVGGSWARGQGKGPLRFRSVRTFDRWLAARD